MADKLLLVSVFVVLGFMGELPLWLVIVAVSRDALIVCAVLLSTVMGNPVEMKPLMVSKANTAVQIVLAAVVLAELAFSAEFGPLRPVLISPVRPLDRGFRRSLSRSLVEAHEQIWRRRTARRITNSPRRLSPRIFAARSVSG